MMDISPPDEARARLWLAKPGCAAVLDALGEAEGLTRIVGGAVRDALLRRPIHDIDLATQLLPDEVIGRVEAAGLKAVPTGIDHGTVTVVAEHQAFEVTTLRKDVETDGRHAVIAFTKDWSQDAARRDFTMNALYADRAGRIYDGVGGKRDLDNRLLRFIGDPETRIREDYLRILRFFRFASQIDFLVLDRDGIMACAKLASGMEGLSAERVAAEVQKLLVGYDPVDALRQMAAAGILSNVLPEAGSMARLDAVVRIERDRLFETDPIRRLYALAGAQAAVPLATRLRLSNKAIARLQALAHAEGVNGSMALVRPVMTVAETQKALHRLGAECFRDLAIVLWADEGANSAHENLWRALLALSDVWQPRKLPVSGEDVMAAGIEAGPRVGEILSALDHWWAEAGFPERDAVLEKMKTLV